MPQLQIIDRPPSFGENLGKALGGGISEGISSRLGSFLKQKEDKAKIQNQMELLKSIAPGLFSQQEEIASDIESKIAPSMQEPSQLSTRPSKSAISDQQLLALGLVNPNIAKIAQKNEQMRLQELESAEKSAAPYMEEYRRIKTALPDLTTSINVAEDAVKSGDLSGFGSDYWSEKLNFPQLLTAKGKQLKSATKNFMAQGKELFGARPTNYDVSILEQMFARIGESKWAQLSAIEMQKARRDLQEAKVLATDDIRRQSGGIPRNIDLLVDDKVKQREKDIQDNLRSRLEIYAALDGQKVDFRNTKKILGEDEYLVLENGKPIGTATSREIAKLKKENYRFIK